MAYYKVPCAPAMDWHHPSSGSYVMRYPEYYDNMADRYSSQWREFYQHRYAALQQYYHSAWYNFHKGIRPVYPNYYMYNYQRLQPQIAPQTTHPTAPRYVQQRWGLPIQQQSNRQSGYSHQLQLPYRLFQQMSAETNPMSNLQLNSDATPNNASEPNAELMDQDGGLDFTINHQSEESVIHDATFSGAQMTEHCDRPKEHPIMQHIPLDHEGFRTPGEIVITESKTALTPFASEDGSQYSRYDEDTIVLLKPNVQDKQHNGDVEGLLAQNIETSMESLDAHKEKLHEIAFGTIPSSLSLAAKDLMEDIMNQRAFGKTPKQSDQTTDRRSAENRIPDCRSAPNMIPDCRSAANRIPDCRLAADWIPRCRPGADILAEESLRRNHHNVFNDTVAANLSGTLPPDEDLENLIVIDQNLDRLLNNLEKSLIETELGKKAKKREKTYKKHKLDTPKTGRRKIQHICEICGRRLSCRASKNVHMRIHTGERPYECFYCPKKFAHRQSWAAHLRTHTGEKPYSCYACPKAFSNYSSWQKHKRLHTGEKPYTCWICKKTFSQPGNLNRHAKTHVTEVRTQGRRLSGAW